MVDLLLLLLVVTSAYCLGTGLWCRLSRLVLDGWPRRLVFRLGLGLGVAAYLVLAVGSLGGLSRGFAWGLLVLGWAAGGRAVVREIRAAARMRQRTAATPLDFAREETFPGPLASAAPAPWLTVAAWLLVGLLGLLATAVALAPPRAYDDLTYHLAAPKVFCATGRVSILPYDHHTAFPFTLEMLYTWAMLLSGTSLARLIHLAMWLLTLLAVAILGNDYCGRRVGPLAVIAYAATPVAAYQAGTAYTEFGYALYQLLAVIAFLEYLNLRATTVDHRGEGPRPRLRLPGWLGVAGVAAGFTIGCKLTGGLLAAFLAGAVVVCGWRDRLRARAVRVDLLVFCLLAAAVGGPWLGRSWLATGNPFFPFAHSVFPSPQWSSDRAEAYAASQREFGRRFVVDPASGGLVVTEASETSHRSPARLLTALWHLTFDPDWFYDRGHNYDGKARFGPVYLSLLPLAVGLWLWLAASRRGQPRLPGYRELRDETSRMVFKEEFGREVPVPQTRQITEQVTVDTPRCLGLLLAYLLFVGLVWFVSMQYSRYFVPHLALAAVVAGWAADRLAGLRLTGLAVGLLWLLQASGGLAYAWTNSYPALHLLGGSLPADSYAAAAAPAYRAMQWANQNLPPEATVILYGEPRGYWLDRPYLWGERTHHMLVPEEALLDLDSYLAWLTARLGVTHALVNETVFPLGRTTGGDEVARLTEAVAAGRAVAVFRDERRQVVVFELR